MTFRSRIRSAILFLVLATSLLPLIAKAQGTLRGKVVDSDLGSPVVGAIVRVGKTGQAIKTDSAGVFVAQNVTSGVQEVSIRMIGFEEGVFDVRINSGALVEGVFPLEFNGIDLPAIVIEARAEALAPRYSDFERRRNLKLGTFLRWDELKKRGFMSVGDALRTVRGVHMTCDQQSFECYAYIRTPQCQPTWYVDGQEVRSFHENTPIRDVYGIEVYRGPGEVPGEYGGSNAGCGVIAVWTKSKPYR